MPKLACTFALFAAFTSFLPAVSGAQTCSPIQQTLSVRELLRDLYLWSDQIPYPDPARGHEFGLMPVKMANPALKRVYKDPFSLISVKKQSIT